MNIAGDTGLMSVLPEVCFPNVDPGKTPSPVIEFLADEEAASTRPLLTPSPPSEFERPSLSGLSLMNPPSGLVAYERQISPSSTDIDLASLPVLTSNVAYVGLTDSERQPSEPNDSTNTDEGRPVFDPTSSVQSVMDSSSSSSSVLQEPTACAQLLSSHHYQHLTKTSDVDPFTCQENGGKPPLIGLQLAVRKSPEDFRFLAWNWPLIRKISFWGTMSLLMGCMCIIVGIIASLPSQCDPEHGWWQGTLFYEIFPASFQDSNKDGIGDLRGLASRAQYLESLGVRAVRLNSVFPAQHYPEGYENIHNLTDIESTLGTLADFDYAVAAFHRKNISVVLDLPIFPFLKHLVQEEEKRSNVVSDNTRSLFREDSHPENNTNDDGKQVVPLDPQETVVSVAIKHWLGRGVDGFYLKGLENLVDDADFVPQLKRWRRIVNAHDRLGAERILMCSEEALNAALRTGDEKRRDALLNAMDLVDFHLNLFGNGTRTIKEQIDAVTEGVLYSKPGLPWVHWHLGSVDTQRFTSQLQVANASLATLLLHLMLPGTPSIFYGDEIGLEDLDDSLGERKTLRHMHQLVPMHWSQSDHGAGFTSHGILPWLPFSGAWSAVSVGKQEVVRTLAALRAASPSVYMNGVWKDHENQPNSEMRVVDRDIVVVERWYPRRHSYLVLSNLGRETQTRDLSTIYYGGEVVMDLRGNIGRYVTFQSLTLRPGESIVIKLDK